VQIRFENLWRKTVGMSTLMRKNLFIKVGCAFLSLFILGACGKRENEDLTGTWVGKEVREDASGSPGDIEKPEAMTVTLKPESKLYVRVIIEGSKFLNKCETIGGINEGGLGAKIFAAYEPNEKNPCQLKDGRKVLLNGTVGMSSTSSPLVLSLSKDSKSESARNVAAGYELFFSGEKKK
jgi:hypothetical protein